ncbi:MAG: hypothetical protein WBY97_06575 [Roseiarcus sp.]
MKFIHSCAIYACKCGEGPMIVDPAWAERNIGFDPAKTAAPAGASAYKPAAVPDSDPDNLQREIIDLDSE